MSILFNATALGVYSCKTSQLYNFKAGPGGEIYLSDVNIIRAVCLTKPVLPSTRPELFKGPGLRYALIALSTG